LDVEGVVPKASLDEALNQNAGLVQERDSLHSRLSTIQIDQAVVNAATKRGLRPTAVADITARGRSAFQLVDGAPVVMDADGKTPRKGKDGKAALGVDEWLESQVAEAPHLFAENSGSGAAGNPAGIARPVNNPFSKEHWNLTEQMKLQKADPALAASLKAGI